MRKLRIYFVIISVLLVCTFGLASCSGSYDNSTQLNQPTTGVSGSSSVTGNTNGDGNGTGTGTGTDERLRQGGPSDSDAAGNQGTGQDNGNSSGNNNSSGGMLRVHYIDVGQADSILVQSPGGKNMLIDAGNGPDGGNIVTYLKSQGVKRIDVLVATHPHEDHIGGMDTVVNSFDIGKIYMPKVTTTTKTYKDLINAINKKGLKVAEAYAGVNIDLDSSLSQLIMVAPNSKSYENMNDYSAVIRLVYKNTSFLFAGDAADVSEHEMLSGGFNLSADVLKVGHHGSSTSSSLAFLKAVAPKYAVISVGKGNDYGHPSPAAISRLGQIGAKIFRTDLSGTIVAVSNGNTVSFDKSPNN